MGRPRKQRKASVEIYEGADGWWHGYITIGTKPNGKPDRRHRMGKTEEEVNQKILELEDAMAAGAVPKAGRPPTVAEWLTHWLENIARPTVEYSTYEGSYAYAVYKYLNPGIGAHRLDKLEPEHIEALYRRLLDDEDGPGLSPGTVALIHRTLRTALNEAVKRGRIVKNRALDAKTVESDADEIDPLTADEAKRILTACEGRRNAARWSVALALGLRQGEALGMRWSDVDLDRGYLTVAGKAQRRKWQHGCDDPAVCAAQHCRTQPCPQRWEHGCGQGCGKKLAYVCPQRRKVAGCRRHQRDCPPLCRSGCTGHAAACPERKGGGVVLDEPGGKSGRKSRRRLKTKTKKARRVALPNQVVAELRAHQTAQKRERLAAGERWEDNGLVFASPTGRPIDARRDWGDWKEILQLAGVRDIRVHDARHTAATLLLLKGVDRGVVMDMMGWSNEAMVRRYQHVVDELREEAARRIGDTLWEPRATDLATGSGSRRKRNGA